jgi:CRP-like cAMP-binding protein
MSEIERVLAEHPFFEGFEARHIQRIAGRASPVRFAAGTMIFRHAEPATTFYVVTRGKATLEAYTPERGAMVILTIGGGGVLGWGSLLEPYRWHFDSRAVELTRAIAIDGQELRAACAEDSQFGYMVMKQLTNIIEQRLQATVLQLLDLYGVRR